MTMAASVREPLEHNQPSPLRPTNTIRGFQFRGVGPDVNGFKVGGDFQLLNSLEYQLPVTAGDNLYLVGFVDSGTVERTVEIKDYRVSAGVGVRFTVPLLGPVPIALSLPKDQAMAPVRRLYATAESPPASPESVYGFFTRLS